jgi:fructokinase
LRVRVGIDIGGTKIAGTIVDATGAERAAARCPVPHDYQGTIEAVRGVIADMARQAGVRASCVGVGVPGNVDKGKGSLRFGNCWWLADRPFRDDLAAALGVPVRLANDADCFALSEALDGAGAGAHSVFGVILGTGVGGGFAVDGRLVTGCLGIAGEIGHVPVPRGTPEELATGPCSCGRHGCIETLLSGPSLARDHARAAGLNEPITVPEIAALALRGDGHAEAALQRYEDRLARSLSVLVNIIEPDVIVLGGGVSNLARLYDNLPALMLPHVFGGRCETRVVRNLHGDSSGVRGAAGLFAPSEAA